MTTSVQAVMQNSFKVVVEIVEADGTISKTVEYKPGINPVINYFHSDQRLVFREVRE